MLCAECRAHLSNADSRAEAGGSEAEREKSGLATVVSKGLLLPYFSQVYIPVFVSI